MCILRSIDLISQALGGGGASVSAGSKVDYARQHQAVIGVSEAKGEAPCPLTPGNLARHAKSKTKALRLCLIRSRRQASRSSMVAWRGGSGFPLTFKVVVCKMISEWYSLVGFIEVRVFPRTIVKRSRNETLDNQKWCGNVPRAPTKESSLLQELLCYPNMR